MWRRQRASWPPIVVLGLLWLSGSGCGSRLARHEPEAAPASAPEANEQAPLTLEEAAQMSVDPEPVGEPALTNASVAPDLAPESESRASKERILILCPTHPLIVDLYLSIDCQPHTEALSRLVEEVLTVADEDEDGRTTWKELCECKRVKYGQYGNLVVEGENSLKQVTDRYDVAQDGIVSREELPRFLTRNAGGSRPFSVRGTLSFRDPSRRMSPTWRLLDENEDGRLSKEEWAGARVRLASRDSDDDEIVVPADMAARLESQAMGMMNKRRRGSDAVRLLGAEADWGAVQQALEQAYGGGRFLRSGAFPGSPEMFAALDANGDGRLRKDEYPKLDDLAPHIVLAVEFGSRKSAEASDNASEVAFREQNQPTLKVMQCESPSPATLLSASERSQSVGLIAGGATLLFLVNDAIIAADFAARASEALAMFDQNKDGYLSASELPESLQPQLGRFEALDLDEDAKVYPQEIETYLRQQQAALRAQVHARVTDVQDGIFLYLDADRDGRLTSLELEAASERLQELDRDADGLVTPDELPQRLEVVFARGSIETPDVTFAPSPMQGRSSASGPRWFLAMDANKDGVLSRREFLGTPEQFAALDANANGLIDVDEAPQ